MHVMCTADNCSQHISEAMKLFPRKRDAEERIKYLQARGHYDWIVWLILAGRGWGKTRTGAEDIVKYMLERPRCRVALVAATFADGRDTMVEGESGILSILPKSLLLNWNRSIGELVLTNGARAKIFSAEEPERLRGPQHHRAWADELAAWKYLKRTWDQLMFGLRLEYRQGEMPQVIITTTPKGLKFIRTKVRQSKDPLEGVVVTRGSTFENRRNLAHTTLKALRETYEGTRIGKQELYAEVLDEEGGGVIKYDDIERKRIMLAEFNEHGDYEMFARVAVAVDPAVTDKKTSNETGIVAAGKTYAPCPLCSRSENPFGVAHAVVLEDATPGRVSPNAWAQRTKTTFIKHHADRVVGEVNNGGDLVEANLRAAAPGLPYTDVRASRGKVIRAEPIGALYEKGMVHHLGVFEQLEDQLVMLGVEEDEDDAQAASEVTEDESTSPDRADACVWVLTELMIPKETTTIVGTATDTRGHGSR
jgi:phage terminase large subunit-like protein